MSSKGKGARRGGMARTKTVTENDPFRIFVGGFILCPVDFNNRLENAVLLLDETGFHQWYARGQQHKSAHNHVV
jgi:hypothetical protein